MRSEAGPLPGMACRDSTSERGVLRESRRGSLEFDPYGRVPGIGALPSARRRFYHGNRCLAIAGPTWKRGQTHESGNEVGGFSFLKTLESDAGGRRCSLSPWQRACICFQSFVEGKALRPLFIPTRPKRVSGCAFSPTSDMTSRSPTTPHLQRRCREQSSRERSSQVAVFSARVRWRGFLSKAVGVCRGLSRAGPAPPRMRGSSLSFRPAQPHCLMWHLGAKLGQTRSGFQRGKREDRPPLARSTARSRGVTLRLTGHANYTAGDSPPRGGVAPLLPARRRWGSLNSHTQFRRPSPSSRFRGPGHVHVALSESYVSI